MQVRRRRGEEFAEGKLPAPQGVGLEQVGQGKVLAEVLAEQLRPDQEGPENKHARNHTQHRAASRSCRRHASHRRKRKEANTTG